MNGGDRRALLEQRAEAVRSRLERRLDALDERRARVVALAQRATRPPVSVILLGTASLIGVALLVHRSRQRSSPAQRLAAALLGAPPRKPDGFIKKALKRAALSVVATVVQRASTQGLDRLLEEGPLDGAPAAPVPDMKRPY